MSAGAGSNASAGAACRANRYDTEIVLDFPALHTVTWLCLRTLFLGVFARYLPAGGLPPTWRIHLPRRLLRVWPITPWPLRITFTLRCLRQMAFLDLTLPWKLAV